MRVDIFKVYERGLIETIKGFGKLNVSVWIGWLVVDLSHMVKQIESTSWRLLCLENWIFEEVDAYSCWLFSSWIRSPTKLALRVCSTLPLGCSRYLEVDVTVKNIILTHKPYMRISYFRIKKNILQKNILKKSSLRIVLCWCVKSQLAQNIIHTICLLLRLGKTLLWWSATYTLETIACIRDQLYQEPWIGCIKGWKCLSYKRHIGCVWWSKTLWSQRTYWVLHTLSLVRIY